MEYKSSSTTSYLIPGVLTAVIIILFYFFFNLNYLSNWIDEKGDSFTYHYYIKLGLPQYLYNPHHLFFDRLGQWLMQAAVKNGFQGNTMRILQVRNLIISSISLGIVFFLFYRFSKRYLLSLLFTCAIGFSCGVWIYAQINDTGLIHSILVFILFFLALGFPGAKHKLIYAVFLGVFHSVIVLTFHQSDMIFFPVVFFIMALSGNFRQAKQARPSPGSSIQSGFTERKPLFHLRVFNLRYFLVYFLVFAALIIIAYYCIGIVVLGLSLDPADAGPFNAIKGSTYFFNWLVLYSNINFWGKGFTKGNLFVKTVKGIAGYFYQPIHGQPINGHLGQADIGSPQQLLAQLVPAFIIVVLLCALLLFVFLYRRYSTAFPAGLLYLAIYTVFACWWEPDYREFWIAPLFAFWFIAFLVAEFILETLKKIWPLPQAAVYVFLFIFSGLLFYSNFTNLIYPHAGKDFRAFDIIHDREYVLKQSGKK